jgi:nucleotide-binding universal stress UspA family protein
MTRKILVTVSTRTAHNLLACAVDASRELDAEIIVVHVVDPLNCFLGATGFDCAPVVEAMLEHGREVIAHAAGSLEAQGCTARTRMLTLPGDGVTVGRAIAALANEAHADLVIIGGKKANWWRWLRDDIAVDILNHTRASIRCVANMVTADAVTASPKAPVQPHPATEPFVTNL